MQPAIRQWMERFAALLIQNFGGRIRFVGLQGSCARGENTDDSDIDVVVLFDAADTETLLRYRTLIDALPERARICGFVSGVETLARWSRTDLVSFYYDTVPFFGRLDAIVRPPDRLDALQAAHAGACAIYHACCHNLLHARDEGALAGAYKAARFVLAQLVFARSGVYPADRTALLERLTTPERAVLEAAEDVWAEPDGAALDRLSARLIDWSAGVIETTRIGRCEP